MLYHGLKKKTNQQTQPSVAIMAMNYTTTDGRKFIRSESQDFSDLEIPELCLIVQPKFIPHVHTHYDNVPNTTITRSSVTCCSGLSQGTDPRCRNELGWRANETLFLVGEHGQQPLPIHALIVQKQGLQIHATCTAGDRISCKFRTRRMHISRVRPPCPISKCQVFLCGRWRVSHRNSWEFVWVFFFFNG